MINNFNFNSVRIPPGSDSVQEAWLQKCEKTTPTYKSETKETKIPSDSGGETFIFSFDTLLFTPLLT